MRAVLCGVVRCCAVLCDVVRFCAVLYGVVRCCAVLWSVVQCCAVLCGVVRCCTRCCAMLCGVVWCCVAGVVVTSEPHHTTTDRMLFCVDLVCVVTNTTKDHKQNNTPHGVVRSCVLFERCCCLADGVSSLCPGFSSRIVIYNWSVMGALRRCKNHATSPFKWVVSFG
jgi:hypothetical protein